MTERQVSYHCAQSFVEITAIKREHTDLASAKRVSTVEVALTLGVEADPNDWQYLDIKESGLTESEFTLGLTDDGRIASASGASTGRAGEVLHAVVGLVGDVVDTGLKLAANAGGLDVLMGVDERKQTDLLAEALGDEDSKGPSDATPLLWELHNPEDASLLVNARQAERELAAKLMELHGLAARGGAGAPEPKRIAGVREGLGEVRAEIIRLEAAKAEWTDRTKAPTETVFQYRVAVRDLPSESTSLAIAEGKENPQDDAITKMLADCSIIVAIDEPKIDNHKGRRIDIGGSSPAILYRRPHPVDLIVYRVDSDEEQVELFEEQRVRELVVDDHSSVEEILFDRSIWGKRNLSAEFSALGSIANLNVGESGDVAAGTKALAAVQGGVIDLVDTVAPNAPDELAVLKRRKELLELERDIAKLKSGS